MNNLVKYLLSATLLTGVISSCSKTNSKKEDTKNMNPVVLMSNLMEKQKTDFSIKISNSFGHSLYENRSISNASVFLEGYHTSEENKGNLKINDIDIPFFEKSYFLQKDSTVSALGFTGKINNFNFTGVGFPSFNINSYATTITDINFSGLIDKKLPRNTDLTVTWTPDELLPENNISAIIISGEKDDGTYITQYKTISDNIGTVTISKSELDCFSNISKIRVFYFKGYEQIYNINSKVIGISSIGFTYSTLFFQ